MKIKVLIVDDEPLARSKINKLLKSVPDVNITGEAANGLEAISAILNLNPDLIFLDIQMPEINGFEVINTIGADKMPYVIFVTAYDQYTLKAFEIHALDYLLKPVDKDRFYKSLNRAIKYIQLIKSGNTFQDQIKNLLKEINPDKPYLDRIVIKSKEKICFCKTEEIEWVEAAGNYLVIHTGSQKHILREKMNDLEKKLDPKKFLRVHRSSIVNIDYIKELQPWFHGDYYIFLKNGIKLTLSRTYYENFKKIFVNI